MTKSAFVIAFFASSSLVASTFSYDVAVNTGALSGTPGTIYFQFNPGDASSDTATASISNFLLATPGSLAGVTSVSGGGSGTLPRSLAIANASANNDALQALTFGSSLVFRVTLLESFTGTALTGSVFNFGLFRSDGVTPLLTTDPDGYAAVINLDNRNRAASFSTTPFATVTAAASGVPEPGTVVLLCAGLSALALFRRR